MVSGTSRSYNFSHGMMISRRCPGNIRLAGWPVAGQAGRPLPGNLNSVAIAAPLLLAALAMGQAQHLQVEQPRLRRDLANGARVYVERRPGLERFALCVALEAGEDVAGPTIGRRHLLEHLFARGDGTVDRTLEGKGCTLSASTTRDTIFVEITGPTAELSDAVQVLRTLFQPLKVTQEQIVREAGVISEENALRPWWSAMNDKAWLDAFGLAGDTLFLSHDELAKATPDEMAAVLSETLEGSRTTVTVIADLAPEAMADQAALAVGPLPKRDSLPVGRESTLDTVPESGQGTLRALVVPGLGFSSTVAALGAAFALQERVPGVQAVFTPSAHTCLVSVAYRDAGALKKAQAMAKDDAATLAIVGKTAARAWARGLQSDPVAAAKTRALLLQTSGTSGTELIVNQADDLQDDAFLAVLSRLVGEGGR